MTESIDIITYYHDCIDGMKDLPAGSVDLVIADPPFGLDFSQKLYNRDPAYVVEGHKVAPEDYQGFSCAWMEQCVRLLRETGSMYVFSGHTHLREILTALETFGLNIQNQIIWKYQFGNAAVKYALVTSHYNMLFVTKARRGRYYFNKPPAETVEERKARYADMEDVWVINREYLPKKMKNVNKLPVKLIRKIMRYSLPPDGVVLDPFLGNGTTHQAAILEGAKKSIGFEINKNMIEVIEANISLVD